MRPIKDWDAGEWFLVIVAGLFTGCALVVYHTRADSFVHECAKHRPLTECEIDAKDLYPGGGG